MSSVILRIDFSKVKKYLKQKNLTLLKCSAKHLFSSTHQNTLIFFNCCKQRVDLKVHLDPHFASLDFVFLIVSI